jgi:FMN phosphatase YigB (HAD superfamily)
LGAANAIPYRTFSSENPVSLTLLFDLDNTLLSNGMDTFLPVYFQQLSNHVADLIDKNHFTKTIFENIQKANDNKRPDISLENVFECSFYSQLGIQEEVIRPRFESFYLNVFPELKSLTSPRPEAVALIDECFNRGYQVLIATNPLFPIAAVEQRLEWAGIPVSKYPFAKVASFETFHFAKPNPAFFAEIMAQIGWPEGPVVVIGDDPVNDITPSKQLGFSSFHIMEQPVAPTNGRHGAGPIEEFLPWLDKTDPNTHLPKIDSAIGLQSVLAAIPSALHTVLANQSIVNFSRKPHADEWSITEILCHLRDVEREVHQPRIEEVLTSENPFLTAENTDVWAESRDYQEQDGQQALKDFLQTRSLTLQQLQELSPEDWKRKARHTIFGRTDLCELIRFVAEHDLLHLRQIFAVLDSK